jgi:hypothetical protein
MPQPICLRWWDDLSRLLEVNLLVFESSILVVVHNARLLLGVTIEEDGLRFLVGVFWPT